MGNTSLLYEEEPIPIVFSHGRPKPLDPSINSLEAITIKIQRGLREALDKLAKQERTTRSEIVRRAIYLYLKSRGIKVDVRWF